MASDNPIRIGVLFLQESGMAQRKNLSIAGVAQYFCVAPSTVYRLAQRGLLPGFKVGGQWRFSQRILEDWIADQIAGKNRSARVRALLSGTQNRQRRKMGGAASSAAPQPAS
jgi:excisionase family DNA binding protein